MTLLINSAIFLIIFLFLDWGIIGAGSMTLPLSGPRIVKLGLVLAKELSQVPGLGFWPSSLA